MKDVELNISALNTSISNPGNYIMILQETNNTRKIALIIGLQEAQAIAASLENVEPVRPLTHDLLLNTLAVLNASLQHVKINDFKEGIFLSSILIKDVNHNLFEINSRTSDAVALAIRQKRSIYISDDLLTQLAIDEPVTDTLITKNRGELEQYSLQKLQEMLSILLAKEDYETASTVRDIISKKEQRQD